MRRQSGQLQKWLGTLIVLWMSWTLQIEHPALSSELLTKKDLIHGESQLRKLLAERPLMAQFVGTSDPIWNWTVRQFAGEGTGSWVFWNNKNPPQSMVGCHSLANTKSAATIQVRKTLTGENQWMATVYELINLRTGPQFNKAWQEALEGKMSKTEWAELNCKLEFKARLLTKDFYQVFWIPQSMRRRFSTNKIVWSVDSESFDEWMQGMDGQQYLKYWLSVYPKGIPSNSDVVPGYLDPSSM